MNMLRKGLAGLFAVLFVFTAVIALFLFNLEDKAFKAETYQQAFANENFYARIPGIMAQALTSAPQMESLPPGMRTLTTEHWETFFHELLPPETLKVMGDQALASVFGYLNNETNTAEISLAPLKSQIGTEAGVTAVINLAGALPVCTLEEITRMTMNFLADGQFALCNPPPDFANFIRPLIQEQLRATAATLPDQLTLLGGEPPAGQADPRQRIKALRLVMKLSPALPLFLFFVMTILAVRSLRDWLAWWGLPLTLTGLLSLVMVWAGAPLVGLILAEWITRQAPSYLPAFLLNGIDQLASAIVNQILGPIGLQGLFILILGMGMAALALALPLFRPKEQGTGR